MLFTLRLPRGVHKIAENKNQKKEFAAVERAG